MFKTDSCIVCLEPFTDNSQPLKRCHHWIHKKCIIKSGKDECPICRQPQPGLNKKELKRLRKVKVKMDSETERQNRIAAEEIDDATYHPSDNDDDSDNEVIVTTGAELLEMANIFRGEFITRFSNDPRTTRLFLNPTQFREVIESENSSGVLNVLTNVPMEVIQQSNLSPNIQIVSSSNPSNNQPNNMDIS